MGGEQTRDFSGTRKCTQCELYMSNWSWEAWTRGLYVKIRLKCE